MTTVTSSGSATRTVPNNEMVSIIIPLCNGLFYLKKTLPVLFQLQYNNFEVIIADNGTDNNLELFLRDYPTIRYIKTKLYSKTIAANAAAKIARGNYLFFLDADALVTDKEILNKLILAIHGDPRACYSVTFKNVSGHYIGLGGKLFIPSRSIKNIFFRIDKKSSGNNVLDYPQGFAFFLSKEIWDTIHGYDETIPFGCEEIDIGFKLKKINVDCVLFKNSIITDIGTPQGQINTQQFNRDSDSKKFGLMILGKMYIIKKYYRLIDLLIMVPTLFLLHLIQAFKKTAKTMSFGYLKQLLKVYWRIISNNYKGFNAS